MIALASCSTTERLTAAATVKGKAAAGVILPDWPSDCKTQEAHADLTEGGEIRSILIRERSALDKQNNRNARCALYYDDLKGKLSK